MRHELRTTVMLLTVVSALSKQSFNPIRCPVWSEGSMRRRELIVLVCGAAVASPLVSHAQVSERLYRVAYFALTPGEDTTPRMKTFQQRLRELGYVEGRNITIDYRSADERCEGRDACADETEKDERE